MDKVYISPSILGIKKEEFVNVINNLVLSGADYIHYDVMDGKFVPNTSFSSEDLKYCKEFAVKNALYDVHLMTYNLKKNITDFISAGADIITFHIEACNKEEIIPLINYIHSFGVKAGLSIKPNTNKEDLLPYLDLIDLVLVMSVEPGFGGQKFMGKVLDKVELYYKYKLDHHLSYFIEIDGGINDLTSKLAVSKGVNMLVAGSYILKSDSYKNAIDSLK